jgi:hypothetical protein
MNIRSSLFRNSCRTLAFVLALGEVPVFAASSPAAVRAESLEKQFAREAAGSGLTAWKPEASHEADMSQVVLRAFGAVDLSRSGALAQERQHALAPDGQVIATQDSHVAVKVEEGVVEVASSILLGRGIGAYAGQPALAGLKIEAVLAIPLDQYRAALAAGASEPGLRTLAQQLGTRPQEFLRTTLTAPHGASVTFAGNEMTLEQALEKVLPDAQEPIGPQPAICICCVRSCLSQLNVNLSIFALVCIAASLGRCANICRTFPPPGIPAACIACITGVFAQCGVRLVGDAVRQFASCIRTCF